MPQLQQYFNVHVSSPKKAKDQVSVDITEYIEDGVKMSDEDGLIKELSFDMKEAFLMLDVMSIGMQVDLFAGDFEIRELLFSGYIKGLTPDFKTNGDVTLKITAASQEGGSLGIAIKDLVFPSKNHPKAWAQTDVTYSDIITNLCKEANVRVDSENIKVVKDIKATVGKGAIRQHNMTDWAFIQYIAFKIHCTCWTTEKNGVSYLHLVDNSTLVNKVSDLTFFFLSRKMRSEFIDYSKTSEKQIQIIECKVNLDTRNAKGQIQQKTDPATGETKLTNEVVNDKGIAERWVLDEEKVNRLSSERRNELIQLFMSGKITWEGEEGGAAAKDYFKLVSSSMSSREGEASNMEVEVSGGNLTSDGINSQNPTKENQGSKTYKTVIDKEKVGKLSPEKRSQVIGRIVRGEVTEADREYYTVVDTTPSGNKDDGNKPPTPAAGDPAASAAIPADRSKRDAGFNITAKVYGNMLIKSRMSYVVEGFGKYSDTYYLYKVDYNFGKSGIVFDLVFTK